MLPPEELKALSDFLDRYRETLLKYQARMFDMGSAYTKVLLGLGYGGFFTLWSFTKDHMGKKESLAAALALAVSLCLFIVFEVWMLYLN